jgi:hypothetical protein
MNCRALIPVVSSRRSTAVSIALGLIIDGDPCELGFPRSRFGGREVYEEGTGLAGCELDDAGEIASSL